MVEGLMNYTVDLTRMKPITDDFFHNKQKMYNRPLGGVVTWS
ncbi:hypothetical protein N781_01740 [Pontibacillus halophilus JSM 076056 = DSM 19796]|uniref:Uncharacterized protein n=1 Tax=Pontibacillus halophilus JSM 076056 = DSM 19796 TaxID=1385510 RepID=A0A0A5IE35_9BACI|nr:hypothetical protein N781_01740 [Pontibacillus halophilus JSM 076056 = DSM 19796]